MADDIKISIPKSLADKIKDRLEGTEFKTVDEYVAYVMRQVIANIEGKETEEKEAYSEEDEEAVKERLKSLGYMD